MKKDPRYYQSGAANGIVACWKQDKKNVPYADMCTGSGKSLVLAMLTNYFVNKGKRVLQLVSGKELVESNYHEAFLYMDKPEALGQVCNKLNKIQNNKQAVIAMMQSFLNKRATSGAFDVLLIDECDLVSFDPDTSYHKIIRSLMRQNPDMLIAGVTATPETPEGPLHEDNIKGKALFTHKVYETPVAQMIKEGYLSHIESISGDVEVDIKELKVSGADYNAELMGVKFDAILPDAIPDIKVKFHAVGIKTAIIYASTLENARKIVEEFGTDEIRLSYGDMSEHDRRANINWLIHGTGTRILVNVGLYIRGFNYPDLDCIVFLLSTKVRRKYKQICGRVIRACESNKIKYILDYGGNIEYHGPIDDTRPVKTKKIKGDAPKRMCTECGTINPLSLKYCSECKAEFIVEDSETGNYSMRSKAQALAIKEEERKTVYDGITAVVPMLYYDKNGKQYLKLSFAQGYKTVHTEHFMPAHYGDQSIRARSLLLNWVKDSAYYAQLASVKFDCGKIYELLNNHAYLFKEFDSVTVKRAGRYFEVFSYRFKVKNGD